MVKIPPTTNFHWKLRSQYIHTTIYEESFGTFRNEINFISGVIVLPFQCESEEEENLTSRNFCMLPQIKITPIEVSLKRYPFGYYCAIWIIP